MATTINTKRVFKLNGTHVTVSVSLLEVHDYNTENGFTPADGEYKPNWYGIDVTVFINNIELLGQVQYDDSNHVEYWL